MDFFDFNHIFFSGTLWFVLFDKTDLLLKGIALCRLLENRLEHRRKFSISFLVNFSGWHYNKGNTAIASVSCVWRSYSWYIFYIF